MFNLHSGQRSSFLIDCEALTDEDLQALASLALPKIRPFGEVVGIPRGGLRFAEVLRQHSGQGPRLVVDDVITTGQSMLDVLRLVNGSKGLVIFSREFEWQSHPLLKSVHVLFQLVN